MARKWNQKEEELIYKELENLYVKKNKTIGEVAKILSLGQSTVYDRLLRLNIKPERFKKKKFNNKRNDIFVPQRYSANLSEFIGVMLGDGHLTLTQVTVTLGTKEDSYAHYLAKLVKKLFKITPKIIKREDKYNILYFGSVVVVDWLMSMGLVLNKVKSQVRVPSWIFGSKCFVKRFLRGFFDTDGSVYKLKFGVQVAFTNRSLPLLESTRGGLLQLGFRPSNISKFRVYLTRKKDIAGFFEKIRPANKKHLKRYRIMSKSWDG